MNFSETETEQASNLLSRSQIAQRYKLRIAQGLKTINPIWFSILQEKVRNVQINLFKVVQSASKEGEELSVWVWWKKSFLKY